MKIPDNLKLIEFEIPTWQKGMLVSGFISLVVWSRNQLGGENISLHWWLSWLNAGSPLLAHPGLADSCRRGTWEKRGVSFRVKESWLRVAPVAGLGYVYCGERDLATAHRSQMNRAGH